MINKLPVLVFLCIVSICAGSIDTNTFLFNCDTVLKSDLEIPAGKRLVIKEGVTVRLEGYRTISVHGLVIAEGTAEKPIVFTSADSLRGDAIKPLWNGIDIKGRAAHGRFRHCRFEGAFRNLVWESSPVFDSCRFYGNHYGIYATKKAAPQIQNCSFRLNTYAVTADFASPVIAGNTISGNVIGIFMQMSSSAFIGKNNFFENQNDIKSEEAMGANKSLMSTQVLWDVMRQCF